MLNRLFTVTPFTLAPRLRTLTTAAVALALALAPAGASAQGGRTLIRDAETESIIRSFSVPLFQAAGQDPSDVHIRIVQDKTLNAFVAGGRIIHIHTGLILSSEGPDALIGVIAHETGHIEGGHLVRTRDAIAEASTIQLIGTILGAAAAVATGRGEVASAGALSGQSMAMRTFFQYSRTQESAADQAAIRLLDATGRSARGLEGFLGQLEGQAILSTRLQDPYLLTHPLSRERIDTLRAHIDTSPYSNAPTPEAERLAFDRMVAKLYGFLESLPNVLKRYPETDKSFAARYARAVAHYRVADLKKALALIDELAAEAPNDAYLFELKGQMLFENGRAAEALTAYREAFRLAPTEPLIALELGRVELELEKPGLLDDAIAHFLFTIQHNEGSIFVWRQLGIAYGRKGDVGMSSLALAEAEYRSGQLPNAEFLAVRARDTLPEGSSARLQALDILEAVANARAAKAQN